MTTEATPIGDFVSAARAERKEPDHTYGPVGTDGAVLQGFSGWREERYRLIRDGVFTEWGDYKDVFALNGHYYVSDYYTGSGTWTQHTAEEALAIVAIQVAKQ